MKPQTETTHGLEQARTSGAEDTFDREVLRPVVRLSTPLLNGAPAPAFGELVADKYRVEEQLGAGGMGVVMRATNVSNGRQVALKWLRAAAPDASARFLIEARAAAMIDHPNVVSVYDHGRHQGAPFLVMELLRGRSLGDHLQGRTLSARELSQIMVPALRGVAAAHARGVIHRDLKPDNIFLCDAPDGGPAIPKVLDFGVSKIRAEGSETMTRPGVALGTPPYMSPEQIRGGCVDERTDIWAAGVIMYEALTGQRPFRADNDAALAFAIVSREPAALRALEPSVPASLERLVLRALAKDPCNRLPNVESLLQELSHCLESAPESSAPLARTNTARRRVWQLGGVSLAAALAVLLAGSLLQHRAGPAPARALDAERVPPLARSVEVDLAATAQTSLISEGPIDAPSAASAEDGPQGHAPAALQKTTRETFVRRPPRRVRPRAGTITIDQL